MWALKLYLGTTGQATKRQDCPFKQGHVEAFEAVPRDNRSGCRKQDMWAFEAVLGTTGQATKTGYGRSRGCAWDNNRTGY
ncbi:hypothetical protein AVEN_86638-1 [Araneus ventricosus]|uniref:Uncharacterized protein n=1 Tax=Araneus ventricosus TaxID=182803 RepID=A0A4Y2WM31_ARAVE|nr:hypothetical protein AVEN_86638-1 [Araneus ventricosus]